MAQQSETVVQVTRRGTVLFAGPGDLGRLREEFSRRHCIRLPQLLDAATAQGLLDAIDRSEFVERVHPEGGTPPPTDWCLVNDKVSGGLSFLLNDGALFDLIDQLTGCRVGSFGGVVYRLERGRSYDNWHHDVKGSRMLAISINLTRGAYAGGVLQIREKGSRRIVHAVANTGLGDAVLFRIAPHLEHRVSEITGDVARTAFAGWFASQPDFMTVLKGTPRPAA